MPTLLELQWPEKQPGSVLDYSVDLSGEIEPGDTIVSVSAMIRPSGPDELAIGGRAQGDSLYATGSVVTIWLQGGVPGRHYLVRLLVTMTSGRVFDIMVVLAISDVLAVTPRPPAPITGFSTAVVWQAAP
jgi:hypothetical protein